MSCLSREQLARAALGLSEDESTGEHLRICVKCEADLETMRLLVRELAGFHGQLNQGHEMARERLMSALAERGRSTRPWSGWNRIASLFGDQTMRRRMAFGGVVAAVIVSFASLWLGLGNKPAFAMGRLAEKIREAKSCEWVTQIEWKRSTEIGKPLEVIKAAGKTYWLAPDTYRLESRMVEPLATVKHSIATDTVQIVFKDKPGIFINLKQKNYQQVSPKQGQVSPLMLLEKLGQYSGQTDRSLGTQQIDGKLSRGFAIESRKIDPDAYSGDVEIWIDGATELPVLVDYEMKTPGGGQSSIRMVNFRWNAPLDRKLFDITPPEGFAAIELPQPDLQKQVDEMVKALKIFAEFSGGQYPRVKMVYGDVTRDELIKLSGISWPTNGDQMSNPKVAKIYESMTGFALINGVLRDNPDAAYFGKSVGPNDKQKVLLYWKLEDGRFEVIFGDLHSEVLGEERLKGLKALN